MTSDGQRQLISVNVPGDLLGLPSLALARSLDDPTPSVRIAAAEAFGHFGSDAEVASAVRLLVTHADWKQRGNVFEPLAALSSLDALGGKVAREKAALRNLPTNGPAPHARYSSYVGRQVENLQERIK